MGITSVLFIGLMVGVNSNINQQRYRESVFNLSTDLQDQYNEVDNTRNERDENWRCVDGNVAEDATSGEARGTSECVLLGRAVEIYEDGTKIRTLSVIGVEPSDPEESSDIGVLNEHNPKLSTFSETDDYLDWGVSLKGEDNRPSTLSMLILRSPASGLLRVFASENPLPSDLSTMINAASTNDVSVCIDGDRGTLPRYSLVVNPSIAGPDGIVVQEGLDGEGNLVC